MRVTLLRDLKKACQPPKLRQEKTSFGGLPKPRQRKISFAGLPKLR